MFDPEFFPTPPQVIERMLAPWLDERGKYDKLKDLRILDPSAGSGAILRHIISKHPYGFPRMDAVEINPACRTLLGAIDGVSVEGEDFLSFNPELPYDLIVMNPPFSEGDKHLLHAWEIMKRGDIVCLLNAETIRNPHTHRRKRLLELIEANGSVEFLGPVFAQAERRTDVDVALVRLARAEQENDRFAFWHDSYFQRERFNFDFDDEVLGNLPAVNDLVASMVLQFRQVHSVFVEYLKAMRRLNYHLQPLLQHTAMRPEKLMEECTKWQDKPEAIYASFTKLLTGQAWVSIIGRTKLHDLMTESVRRDFVRLQEDQGKMAFTEENIRALFALLFQNQHKILQRSIEESFDLMTRYHKENRVHDEGWCSNDAFKVAPKVVLPNCIEQGYSRKFSVDYRASDRLNDIDRGIAMVEGKKLGQVLTIANALKEKFASMDGIHGGALSDNVCASSYFRIRFFKKGTIHLTWLDEALRQRFNIAAAQGKQWLPMDYGRKSGTAQRHDDPQQPFAKLLLVA